MSQDTKHLLDTLDNLRRNEHEGPHKPLLVLLALSRWVRFGQRFFPYADIHEQLKSLIERFRTPVEGEARPRDPFWRLQKDQIWMVQNPEDYEIEFGDKELPSHEDLIEQHAWGRFWTGMAVELESVPSFAFTAFDRVLCQYFEPRQQADIMRLLWR